MFRSDPELWKAVFSTWKEGASPFQWLEKILQHLALTDSLGVLEEPWKATRHEEQRRNTRSHLWIDFLPHTRRHFDTLSGLGSDRMTGGKVCGRSSNTGLAARRKCGHLCTCWGIASSILEGFGTRPIDCGRLRNAIASLPAELVGFDGCEADELIVQSAAVVHDLASPSIRVGAWFGSAWDRLLQTDALTAWRCIARLELLPTAM